MQNKGGQFVRELLHRTTAVFMSMDIAVAELKSGERRAESKDRTVTKKCQDLGYNMFRYD